MATSVIFVHGTGTRGSELATKIKKYLRTHAPTVHSVACLWGDAVGAKLHLGGASVPTYPSTRAVDGVEPEDEQVTLWAELYRDPLFEVRHLLFLHAQQRRPFVLGVVPLGTVLERRLRTLEPEGELQTVLEAGEIGEDLHAALRTIVNSREGQELLRNADEPLGPVCAALARAAIARALWIAEEAGRVPRAASDAACRDAAVALLVEAMKEGERSFLGTISAPLTGAAAWLATRYAVRKRGAVTDATYPFAADILLYQARGEPIRNFIHECIESASSPVVLLAHSLGGIACVDLLVKQKFPKVALLVTVGSQAPFLYELGALPGLPFGEPLPKHLPKWLNIYDLRDLLSYRGSEVFPGRVEDVQVDSRQSFPWSHSAYWDNKATWDAIVPRLP